MHCSANVGTGRRRGSFFGLSGTGKTTLSADPERTLIGDDEHGWSRDGIFNFEGGCYAKAISLSREAEPEIYATTRALRHRTGECRPRSADAACPISTTAQRPRIRAPPIRSISSPTRRRPAAPGHPKNIVMLTADAFGVMPPIAKLDAEPGDVSLPLRLHGQSRRHREGRDRAAGDILDLLRRTIHAAASLSLRQPAARSDRRHNVDCWLVNTGWTGGKFGTGRRMPIRVTRRLLAAALDGSLNRASFRTDPYFGLAVPSSVPGVEPHILNPVKTWQSKSEFAETAKRLVNMFRENFVKFEPHVDAEVKEAAPTIRIAAE